MKIGINKLFIVIILIIFGFQMKAQNNLRVKFDDGGIVKWEFSENFEPSIVNKNLREMNERMVRLSGKQIEIFIPLNYIEWTIRTCEDEVLLEGDWQEDWGWEAESYILSEKDGKILIGNLPEDTAIDACKDYLGKECRYLTVTGELERDTKDGYNVFMYNSTIMFVFPKK